MASGRVPMNTATRLVMVLSWFAAASDATRPSASPQRPPQAGHGISAPTNDVAREVAACYVPCVDGTQTGDGLRILIVRLSALGDVIHGLPVACALRRAFPGAFLGWVVEGRAGDLLEGHPALDTLIRAPRGWLKSPTAVRNVRRELKAHRFDVTVDLQCLTKSAVMAWLSGAKRRLGVGGADGREFSKWFNNCLTLVDAPHVIDHYLGILAPLGIINPPVEFQLPERDEDAEFAECLLAKRQLSDQRFVVFNPGAGWQSKMWPAARYGEVARHVDRKFGLPSLAIWGGPAEQPLAQAIVAESGGTAHLAPATSLRQLCSVVRRARLFVGSDTGPMHLAVAVQTPTISLHGPSRSDWCGAYGDSNLRLQAYYAAGSAKQRRRADNAAMCAISTAQVCDACDQMLTEPAQRRCG